MCIITFIHYKTYHFLLYYQVVNIICCEVIYILVPKGVFLPKKNSISYRLMTEDWSDWTIPDMAIEFGVSEDAIKRAIKLVKRNFEYDVQYIKKPTKVQRNTKKFVGQTVHGKCKECGWYSKNALKGYESCDYNYYAYLQGLPKHGQISEKNGGCNKFAKEVNNDLWRYSTTCMQINNDLL